MAMFSNFKFLPTFFDFATMYRCKWKKTNFNGGRWGESLALKPKVLGSIPVVSYPFGENHYEII